MVVITLVVGVVVICAAVVAVVATSRTPPPRELLPSAPEYRNHQAMARWIQRRVDDELLRPMLAEADQVEARRLLGEFYGEEQR